MIHIQIIKFFFILLVPVASIFSNFSVVPEQSFSYQQAEQLAEKCIVACNKAVKKNKRNLIQEHINSYKEAVGAASTKRFGGVSGYFATGAFGLQKNGELSHGHNGVFGQHIHPISGSQNIIFSNPPGDYAGIQYTASGISYEPGFNTPNGSNTNNDFNLWKPSKVVINSPGVYAISYYVNGNGLASNCAWTVTVSNSFTRNRPEPQNGSWRYQERPFGFFILDLSAPASVPCAIDIRLSIYSSAINPNTVTLLQTILKPQGTSQKALRIKNIPVAASLLIVQIG